jgi:hypothetical protein
MPYHFKIGRPCPLEKGKACLRDLKKKYTEMFSAKVETFLANTSDLETQQKVKKPLIMKRLS